jgi:hypothetical protein
LLTKTVPNRHKKMPFSFFTLTKLQHFYFVQLFEGKLERIAFPSPAKRNAQLRE